MYVLNWYANYFNGNQEAWPLQLGGSVPVSFFFPETPHRVWGWNTAYCGSCILCCLLCSWKLNVPFASNRFVRTAGGRYHKHMSSRGIELWLNADCKCMVFPCIPTMLVRVWLESTMCKGHTESSGLCLIETGYTLLVLHTIPALVSSSSFSYVWWEDAVFLTIVHAHSQDHARGKTLIWIIISKKLTVKTYKTYL